MGPLISTAVYGVDYYAKGRPNQKGKGREKGLLYDRGTSCADSVAMRNGQSKRF